MKPTQQNAPSAFGRYLQRKRLARGISLADVSEQTRIRIQTLLAIEKEEHHKLPAEIYVKGLLRNYARAVGASEEKVTRRYEQSRKEIGTSGIGRIRSSTGRWFKLVSGTGVLLLVAAVSIYLMLRFSGGPPVFSGKEPETTANKPAPEGCPVDGKNIKVAGSGRRFRSSKTATSDAGGKAPPNATLHASGREPVETRAKKPRSAAGEYLLSIRAVSDTWLKVIADDQAAVKYQLKKGDRMDLTAFNHFNILIGNARGVRLFVNDHALPVSGKAGQIVNINIP